MSITHITVKFESDEEGFVSRSCPSCHLRFKIKPSESEPSVVFCPFCKREGNRWETPEQIEYRKGIAKQKVVQPALDRISESFRKLGRSGGGIRVKVTGGTPRIPTPTKPRERLDEMREVFVFDCCQRSVRHSPGSKPTFCPTCGKPPAA
jgi:hypothetical protein